MSTQYLTRVEEPPVPPYHAEEMAQGLYGALAWFLAPLLMELDARIDKRLVRTLVQTVRVILTFRDRVNGLLRSRMGGYLDTPDKAPAGTKRLSRLVHCAKWSAELIWQFHGPRATRRLEAWKEAGLDALAIWDESVWEKPESFAPEEFGPVRSSKAARLTRIKKGYYSPPRGPIFVPGLTLAGSDPGGPRSAARSSRTSQHALVDQSWSQLSRSNAMSKANSCSNWRPSGDEECCMSLTKALRAVSGWACSLPSPCVLCCAGRKTITWWMLRATDAQLGKSPAASEGGRSGRCGTAAAICGCGPAFSHCRCVTPIIWSSRCGWSSPGAKEACPGIC